AGLAIPDFPWMFGHLVPDHWSPAIAVHFAHRVGALVVTCAILLASADVWSRHRGRRELTRPAALLPALVAVQVTLGALTVLSQRNPWINSVHVVGGALVLTTSLVLTLRSWRVRFAGDTVRLPARRSPTQVRGGEGGKADATSDPVRTATASVPTGSVRSVRLQADRDQLQRDRDHRSSGARA